MTASNRLPISSAQLVALAVVGIVAYQVAMMWAWLTFPDLDWVLLRFSLSNADAIALAAFAIALYSYSLYARTTEAGDLQYLQEFVAALRKEGLDPETGLRDLAALMGSGARWWRRHESEVRDLAPALQVAAAQLPKFTELLPDAASAMAAVDVQKARRTLRTVAALMDKSEH